MVRWGWGIRHSIAKGENAAASDPPLIKLCNVPHSSAGSGPTDSEDAIN